MSSKGRKWSPEQLVKFQRTMKARRKAKTIAKDVVHKSVRHKDSTEGSYGVGKPDGRRKDAIIYLRHASTAIHQAIRKGRLKEIDRAHLLTLLALRELEEEN